MVSLHSCGQCHSIFAIRKRVFAWCLLQYHSSNNVVLSCAAGHSLKFRREIGCYLVPAPARVSCDIDIRRPKGKGVKSIHVSVCGSSSLATHDSPDFPPQRAVEGRRNSDRHREGGGVDMDVCSIAELYAERQRHTWQHQDASEARG
eukprot:SAG31_NODE_317_length_17813_cov_5.788585_7_plen_147_part_00